jgi:hypothetical protein
LINRRLTSKIIKSILFFEIFIKMMLINLGPGLKVLNSVFSHANALFNA